MLVLKVDDVLM